MFRPYLIISCLLPKNTQKFIPWYALHNIFCPQKIHPLACGLSYNSKTLIYHKRNDITEIGVKPLIWWRLSILRLNHIFMKFHHRDRSDFLNLMTNSNNLILVDPYQRDWMKFFISMVKYQPHFGNDTIKLGVKSTTWWLVPLLNFHLTKVSRFQLTRDMYKP